MSRRQEGEEDLLLAKSRARARYSKEGTRKAHKLASKVFVGRWEDIPRDLACAIKMVSSTFCVHNLLGGCEFIGSLMVMGLLG